MVTRKAGSDRGTVLPLVMRAVGLAVLALLFSACGNDGSIDRPTTSESRLPSSLPSPTAQLSPSSRSPERSEPPRRRGRCRSQAPPPGHRRARRPPRRSRRSRNQAPPGHRNARRPPRRSRPSRNQAPPGHRKARRPPRRPRLPRPPSHRRPHAAVEPSAAESSGAPSWLWWLLAAVVLAVVVAVPLIIRARRRGAWRADLASAEDEMAWFARVLVAELRQMGSLAEAMRRLERRGESGHRGRGPADRSGGFGSG